MSNLQPIVLDEGMVVVYPPCDGAVVTRDTWVAFHNRRKLWGEGDTPAKAKANLTKKLLETDTIDHPRGFGEIRVAHDIIGTAKLGIVPVPPGDELIIGILMTCLCWVLGHRGGAKVSVTLGMLVELIRAKNQGKSTTFEMAAGKDNGIDYHQVMNLLLGEATEIADELVKLHPEEYKEWKDEKDNPWKIAIDKLDMEDNNDNG